MAVGDTAWRLVSPIAGALSGMLLQDHGGMSVGFVALMVAGSLGFGLWSAAGRNKNPDARHEALRLAFVNAGALWVLCLSVTFGMSLALPAAMGMSLMIGLFGSRMLDRFEASATAEAIITRIAEWWLGKVPPK